MKVKYISQAWLVLVLALSFGGALAGVDVWLQPRIAANKLAATIDEIPKLVPGADKAVSEQYQPKEVTVGEGKFKTTYEAFWALDGNSTPLGWVIKASGAGFADKIELLIGVDPMCKVITGLSILDQKETPGLGNKIEDVGDRSKPGFLWQFRKYGHHADEPLAVTTASPKMNEFNKIQAVTGATISSRSVCNIINEALSVQLRTALAEALIKGPASRPAKKE
jgi:Na+-translocating ferredoxin:NAD+ oxidoreductase subunit G